MTLVRAGDRTGGVTLGGLKIDDSTGGGSWSIVSRRFSLSRVAPTCDEWASEMH